MIRTKKTSSKDPFINLSNNHNYHRYDYGARMYDPVIGRFHTQDPALELYYEWTPYNYVGNNPIRRTDPTGMIWADSTAVNDLKIDIQGADDLANKMTNTTIKSAPIKTGVEIVKIISPDEFEQR